MFGETPLILRYDYKGGESKMRLLKTIKNTLILMIKRKFIKFKPL